MRQNKNITIAYDLSEEKEKDILSVLEGISESSQRSLSQVSKTLIELGLILFIDALEKSSSKNETK